jgi:hypothetical protein
MQTSTYQRALAISGILFVVLLAAAFVLTSSEVDETASVAKAYAYWSDHKTAEIVAAVLLHIATVLLVFFGAGLRSTLRGGEGEESTYSVIAFGGAVLGAAGFAIAALIGAATVTAADQGSREAVYTLNQLNAVDWIPFTAGLSAMMLAVGIGGLRTLTLPKSLSWPAIVLGIVFITPFGWASFVALPFWVIPTSVLLYRGQRARGQHAPGGRAAAAGSPA